MSDENQIYSGFIFVVIKSASAIKRIERKTFIRIEYLGIINETQIAAIKTLKPAMKNE